MATYKGKTVKTKELSSDDPRFDRNIAKVVILKDDGTDGEAVPKSEVTGA